MSASLGPAAAAAAAAGAAALLGNISCKPLDIGNHSIK